MKKDERVYLDDIMESIALLEQYAKGIREYEFFENHGLQDSVIRRLEIIGEAAKRLSSDFKMKHSTIPWREIAGTRDKIVHEYSGVDLSRIWKTVKDDIPALKKELKKILEKMG